jgi:hypothetical protein
MRDIFFDPILDPILRLAAGPEPASGSGAASGPRQPDRRTGAPEDEPWPASQDLEVRAREQQATIARLRQRVREVERELDILRDYVRSIRSEGIPDPLT